MITVTDIGEFVRFHSCERRFKLGLNSRAIARAIPFSERLFNTLDPVLQAVGRETEDKWERALRQHGVVKLDDPVRANPQDTSPIKWEEIREVIERIPEGTNTYAREIEITGRIGAFDVTGRIDFLLVLWDRGTPRIRLIEGKASRKDRTYHRIQLSTYVRLLSDALNEHHLAIAGHEISSDAIEGAVARIDEVTNEPQDILAREALNLDIERADLERLLAPGGLLESIVGSNLDELDFQIGSKCDGCVFSVHCLPESARQRRLELTGLAPTTCHILRANGIQTIDALADLDPAGPLGLAVKQADGFDQNLSQLVRKATARRSTLPGPGEEGEYPVQALPNSGSGQLPLHEIAGRRLVRIYLQVDYDYSENRIGALTAHVTASDHELHTPFHNETHRPRAEIVERRENAVRIENQPMGYEERAVSVAGRDIVHFKSEPWSGVQEEDTAAERQLLQQFLNDMIDAIGEIAEADHASIHFYVYSRSEMSQLVEACTRAGGNLLSHLRELLGSRESLEQLIFSCVQDEIDSRFALGWTGRGLCVATSLTWFGQRYHWTRRVSGAEVQLDRLFEQDIFDFRTTLDVGADGAWARTDAERVSSPRFEIRSRFHDSLTAPYWRAQWGTLPDPEGPSIADQRTKAAIRRYNRIRERPGIMRGYLIARTHALRWLDERVRFKNDEIEKPALDIAQLRQFQLGIDTTRRAAIDFLRLDHHVRMTDWLTSHIQPLAGRVQTGRTIPVRSVRTGDRSDHISADFDVGPFGLTGDELSRRSAIDVGSFVRLAPRANNPDQAQTLRQLTAGGSTCRISGVDWVRGTIEMDVLFNRGSTYVLQSNGHDADNLVFEFASIDESRSDFVAGRVEDRLNTNLGNHVFNWFEPSAPQISALPPLTPQRHQRITQTLDAWQFPQGAVPARLTPDQRGAVLDGLGTRVHLVKGPPGTGKTVTTATSVLARVLARYVQGDVILLAAHTHQAVDTLVERLLTYRESFFQEAVRQGIACPPIVLSRVHSSDAPPDNSDIRNFNASPCVTQVRAFRQQGVCVIAGTTGALLKMVNELNTKLPYRDAPQGFQIKLLVVDEASMMVFPHFLALATLVDPAGEIMLAGDNRQLAPIVSHDWETEDRPPAQYYQPFKSAYEAVLRIIGECNLPPEATRQSSLIYTFRLPPVVRDLIARLYRNLDQIELLGRDNAPPEVREPAGRWSDIWADHNSLVLVVHSERRSRQSNPTEASIIEQIIRAQNVHAADSIAVITPHRAQRALLKGELEPYAEAVSVIDTVERLQGGERPTIIVSGTESDPYAIGAAAGFILNLNRANVAFSRTQQRLIVVCAATLLDYVPTELEDYESALLWKSLRNLCRRELMSVVQDGINISVLAPAFQGRAG